MTISRTKQMDHRIIDESEIHFVNVYSHPGDMESVVREFTVIFNKIIPFLKPLQVDSHEGLGWVLIELLNNAVRSPVSLAMNAGITDINEIDFYTDIIIIKAEILDDTEPGTLIEISVMNRGIYQEEVYNSIQTILNGEVSILYCEERFRIKGSYTGNGGMGIILSKKQVENALGGTLTLTWHDGFYDFKISFPL